MPRATILLPVFRPGGIQMVFDCLRLQTEKDFELVIMDHRWEKRHREVMALAEESGVNTVHVPEHRRNGKWAVVAVGLEHRHRLGAGRDRDLHAGLRDRAARVGRAPPRLPSDGRTRPLDSLALHLLPPAARREQAGRVGRAGPAGTLRLPAAEGHGAARRRLRRDRHLRQRDPAGGARESEPWPAQFQCQRSTPEVLHQVPLFWHVHMRNESGRRSLLWRMNGMDENLDRGKAHIDIEFGRRLSMLGVEILSVPRNDCAMFNPRTLFPTMPQTDPSDPERWSYEQCEDYSMQTSSPVAPNPRSLHQIKDRCSGWENPLWPIDVQALEIPDAGYYEQEGIS